MFTPNCSHASSLFTPNRSQVALPTGKKGVTVRKDAPPAPSLVVASLHIQTILNNKHVAEIAMASVISHGKFYIYNIIYILSTLLYSTLFQARLRG